jgi:bifunctional non-homologous end joining protein LigD
MLIRKNTKAFKTITEIITACQERKDREKLVRLYITKAGHSIKDRISVEGIEGEAGLFYEMNYQTVLNSLKSANHQLHQSDDVPGIYFFHSTSNKAWHETPFEFDEAVKKEFADLPDLPVVRKKEKQEKFVLPTRSVKTESKPVKKEKTTTTKTVTKKAAVVIDKGPKQPDYKLKHKIHFTDLERMVIRQPRLSKKDVLDYYNRIAEYILPYLKDRPLLVRVRSNDARSIEYKDLEAFAQRNVEIPGWLQTSSASKSREQGRMLLCNDKEHLLFYAEAGCLEFLPDLAKAKSLDLPDYIIIGIESPEGTLGQAVDVALTAQDILSGLQLPSFVKTDGMSGLHVYIPLDSKSKFETSKQVAGYLCKLVRLKIPNLIALKGSEDNSYQKVSLDYLLNEERQRVVAPYSLVPGASATVATPLLWEEVKEGLQPEIFNHETIFKRLKQTGDPFETLFKKKVDAKVLLERMEADYSFLF